MAASASLDGPCSSEQAARSQHPPPERVEHRLARRALADRREQLLLERLEPPVDEVFLGREVVVDRLLGHVRRAGDLRDRHPLEPALGEQAPGGLGDQLPRLLLLALPQPAGPARSLAHRTHLS